MTDKPLNLNAPEAATPETATAPVVTSRADEGQLTQSGHGQEQPSQGQEQASGEQPQRRKFYVVPFHAIIQFVSPVKVLDDERAEVVLNGEPLVVPIAVPQRGEIREKQAEDGQPYRVTLWFKTSDGVVTDMELSDFNLPKKKGLATEGAAGAEAEGDSPPPVQALPNFQIGGRIVAVDREEGKLTLSIEPNKKGALTEAFTVDVWIALELMEGLQKEGRTMLFRGEYRPGSGRLVVKEALRQFVGERTDPKKTHRKHKKAKPAVEGGGGRDWGASRGPR